MSLKEYKNVYAKNGISVEKKKQGIKLTYDGLLAKSGADVVYASYGYGDKWLSRAIHEMHRTGHGFEITIPTNENVTNVVFKDSANNWDNNSGRNYSFG
jgi:hypothetical protein